MLLDVEVDALDDVEAVFRVLAGHGRDHPDLDLGLRTAEFAANSVAPKSAAPNSASDQLSTPDHDFTPPCCAPAARVIPAYFGGLSSFHGSLTLGMVSNSTLASLPSRFSTRRI